MNRFITFFRYTMASKEKKALWFVIGAALVLRLIGIDYGLPLWLIGDETASIFGALKMLELKTLIPSFAPQAFEGTLYYGPGLSYVYIIPFVLTIFIKFIFSGAGSIAHLAQILVIDPSIFFIIARLISVVFGTATVLLVYWIGKNLFNKHEVGLWSAIFLGFSLFHVQFSHWARHWTIMTFIFAFALFIITHKTWTAQRRYIITAVLIGMSAWINVNALLVSIFIILWYFFGERRSLKSDLKHRWFLLSIGASIFLIFVGYLIWPPAFGFLKGITGAADFVAHPKTFVEFIQGSWSYFLSILKTDPFLLLFALGGIAWAFRAKHRILISSILFFILYLIILYGAFFFVDRYILVLYPWLAIFAGYGSYQIYQFFHRRIGNNIIKTIIFFFLGLLIFPILHLDWLLLNHDTRILAWNWIEASLPPNARIVIDVPLFRLPPTKEAISELALIDDGALRSVDRAILNAKEPLPLPRGRGYHALNLSAIINKNALNDFASRPKDYDYIILSSRDTRAYSIFKSELSKIEPTASFSGSWKGLNESGNLAMPEGFGDGLRGLFGTKLFGPDIYIYNLRQNR